FAPGSKGFIFVEFDSKNFQGNIVRTITVDVNMGAKTSFTLTLAANVIPEISVNPAIVVLGSIDKDASKTFSLSIQQNKRADNKNDEMDLTKPLSVTTSASFIKARISKANSMPALLIDLVPPLPIGPVREKVILSSNAKYLKELEIPVVGQVSGHVDISTKNIEFGVVTEKQFREVVLTLKSTDKKFDVNSIDAHLSDATELEGVKEQQIFIIEKEKIKESGIEEDGVFSKINIKFKMYLPENFKLKASNTKEKMALNISGFFDIKTNDSDYKEIRIPFFGILRKSL
ncbi:MAG: DUF1573 domain-containing protein, partial [Silvanigrellaceae bacterium]|nr:DUF1573 domain-containing protein [Silvanigrellaceae bacterium]